MQDCCSRRVQIFLLIKPHLETGSKIISAILDAKESTLSVMRLVVTRDIVSHFLSANFLTYSSNRSLIARQKIFEFINN